MKSQDGRTIVLCLTMKNEGGHDIDTHPVLLFDI